MKNLESLKTRTQESVAHLVDLGRQQPEAVQQWGVTAGAALVGALALTAVSKGILGVVATLANPPVALTAGALGGGLFGWSFMQRRPQTQADAAGAASAEERATVVPISSEPPAASELA